MNHIKICLTSYHTVKGRVSWISLFLHDTVIHQQIVDWIWEFKRCGIVWHPCKGWLRKHKTRCRPRCVLFVGQRRQREQTVDMLQKSVMLSIVVSCQQFRINGYLKYSCISLTVFNWKQVVILQTSIHIAWWTDKKGNEHFRFADISQRLRQTFDVCPWTWDNNCVKHTVL